MIARILRHLRLRRAIRAMNATDRRYGGDDALIREVAQMRLAAMVNERRESEEVRQYVARREAALKGIRDADPA